MPHRDQSLRLIDRLIQLDVLRGTSSRAATRRAPPGDAATPRKNRGMVVDGILATFP